MALSTGRGPRTATEAAPVDGPVVGPVVGRRRWRSVDSFRGAVLALMILTPATGSPTTYPWLRHADWNGLTVSDAVFPAFLVTSGLSLAFLLRHPVRGHTVRRLVRRVVLLVVIGVAYNAYGTTGVDLGTARFTGVLQTIGVAGAIAAAAVLVSRRADGADRLGVLVALAVAFPATYGLGLWLLPADCAAGCSPFAPVDTAVFGANHVYRQGTAGFDPEGVAATIAASSLVIVGYLAAAHLRRSFGDRRSAAGVLVTAGLALLAVGVVLDTVQPINKRLMTPSFIAVTAGAALCAFAAFVTALDARDRRPGWGDRATRPMVALGRNALVVFLAERFLLQSATMVHVHDRTAQQWLLDALPVGRPGANLAYTGILLVVVMTVTGLLHRRRRYLAL